MSKMTDQQTVNDLALLGKYKSNSVYSLFNRVKTAGGERLLDRMFENPLPDAAAINMRSRLFQYFQRKKITLPFNNKGVRLAEEYLSIPAVSVKAGNLLYWGGKKVQAVALRDDQYDIFQEKQAAAVEMLQQLQEFLTEFDESEESLYGRQLTEVQAILSDKRLSPIQQARSFVPDSFVEFAQRDHLLRRTLQREMERLLECIYELDVYIAVGNAAEEQGFSYATAQPGSETLLKAAGLRHPVLNNAIPNDIALDTSKNLLFLTGANMAGKSTLMKAIGISVYLAHIGFPVVADKMVFSVMDGLYTSINVSDDLSQGYSHFYAEVLRVKRAAEEVSAGKNMIVIFDELFKGTNVKDAYDATLAVTKAFSEYRNCLFIISTHIVEVGEALEDYSSVQFSYLPTIMKKEKPRYTYTLAEGISDDKHGMLIIKNEGILDIIKGDSVTKV